MNLLPLLDSPKSYDELLSVIGDQSVLDITLSIHRKQGKIKLNEHGKWEIPKPPCMEEDHVVPLTKEHKAKISLAKKKKPEGHSDFKTCKGCNETKPFSLFVLSNNGTRENYCTRCRYHRSTEYKLRLATGRTKPLHKIKPRMIFPYASK